MGQYFMLVQSDPPNAYPARVSYRPDRPGRSWILGRRFDPPMKEPVEAKVKLRKNSVLLDFFKSPLPLMTRRVHQAIVSAGVSNIDTYTARLVDEDNGREYPDYVAFNLIGAIAAAHRAQSDLVEHGSPLIGVDVNRLVIDEEKAGGALMFRLAEAVNGIVVHELIKKAVEAAGIDTLTFMPPEQWIG